MSLVSGSIPNLFNGVSQQPAPIRHTSQCELQENCYPTIATGLRKRPPTEHIAKLRNITSTDAYVHLINRDTTERYSVIVTNGDLEVFDLNTGVAKTVSFPDGKSYLSAATPREDFALLTVADYTFVVNKTKVVVMTGATSSATLTGTVQKFSDLPGAPGVGNVYKIQGDNSNQFDDYYVIRTSANVWAETIAPSTSTTLDSSTMPHKLVRNADGTFTFSKVAWDNRLVGSDTSNPQPSFVGRTLGDVFFYRNRLGVTSDEGIVLSRVGNYFNFWAATVTAVLDTDPIDVGTSHTKVSILNHAIPFNKVLMLFSDQTQFQLTGGDPMTPKNATCDVVTEFESSEECRPVGLGPSLFFAVDRANATGIREYFVDETTVSNDASDVTAHVPSYVPKDVFKLASSSNEDVVFALTLNERNAVYVYKFYWNGDEKVQSSWGKFLFGIGDVILNCDFIKNTAYFVIQRSDGVYLESMSLKEASVDSGLSLLVHLDRRVSLTGSYDSVTKLTTWTLPYPDSGDMAVVLGGSFTSGAGSSLNISRPTSTTITARGDHSAHPCIVGKNYTMRYRFSEQYVRDGDNVALTGGVLKLRRMHLNYFNSGSFQVEVTPLARSTYTYKFTGIRLGTLQSLLGVPSISSGTFRFPLKGGNIGMQIDIVNDTYLPSIFQSAEWDGEFVVKAQRL